MAERRAQDQERFKMAMGVAEKENEHADAAVSRVSIDAGKLDAGKPVDSAALLAAGVISKPRDGVRILGKGELTAKKVEIHAAGASKAAIAAVEKAGGKIVVPVAVAE